MNGFDEPDDQRERHYDVFEEVAAFAQVLAHEGILKAIQDQVRFARARFGHYDVIDFVAVLISYVVSGEPTLLAFYELLAPFAEPFMALFGRNRLPHRSTLSRFLAELDQPTVEALRAILFKYLSFVQINDNMHGSKQLPQQQEETTGQMGILIKSVCRKAPFRDEHEPAGPP